MNVSTNIGRNFLNFIDKHFPSHHKLHKIFNRNTVKVSYSCMSNVKSIITKHNAHIARKNKAQDKGTVNCSCSENAICPLQKQCMTKDIVYKATVTTSNPNTRLGLSPSQEKSRERRTWDIRSISNVTCKNWRENLLLFSTGKPRLRRKNPTVKFGALAGYPSPSLPTFLSYFRAFFDRLRASLFSTP